MGVTEIDHIHLLQLGLNHYSAFTQYIVLRFFHQHIGKLRHNIVVGRRGCIVGSLAANNYIRKEVRIGYISRKLLYMPPSNSSLPSRRIGLK
jgi:hypothetical protein